MQISSDLYEKMPENLKSLFYKILSSAELLDEQAPSVGGKWGTVKSADRRKGSIFDVGVKNVENANKYVGDTGGASRFFYVAKASKSERNKGLDINDLIWKSESWLKPDLSLLMENINLLAKDMSADTSMENTKWSTDLFGNQSMEKSKADLIFTISTVSKLITELKTLNVSQNSNTSVNIQDAIKMIEVNGLSLAESVQSINRLKLNITNEKTVLALGAVNVVLEALLKIKSFAKSQNFHITVKPIKLMEYLIKLVTPKNGTVLDPFMGSGSTGLAAINKKFSFIGIEKDKEYFGIAKERIKNSISEKKNGKKMY